VATAVWQQQREANERAERSIHAAIAHMAEDTQEHVGQLAGVLTALESNPDLRQALKSRDREALLAAAAPTLRRLQADHQITHLYFTGPDRVDILRVHQPDRYGDPIGRFTTMQAQGSGRMAYGLELGPLGTYTLRVVSPWRDDGGTVLGYVELGIESEHLFGEAGKGGAVQIFAFTKKAYLRREEWETGVRMLGRQAQWDLYTHVVAINPQSASLPPALVGCIESGHHPTDEAGPAMSIASDGDRTYAWRLTCLKDASGRAVGDMIVACDMTAAVAASWNTLLRIGGGCLALGAVLFAFFYVFLGRVQHRMLEDRRRLIEESRAREDEQRRYAEHMRTVHDRLEAAVDAAQESEERFRSLFNCAADSIFIHDTDGRFLEVSQEACARLGYTREELLSMTLADIDTPQFAERASERTAGLLAEGHAVFESVHRRKEGTTFPVEISVRLVDYQGRRAVLSVCRDITERKAAHVRLLDANARLESANQRLEELATTDALTGLWNRRRFLEVLERECARAARTGRGLAVAMLDVDHFKAVNDTHGHAFGDRVLAEVAAVLKAEARETDTVARYGGEEFVILMPETSAEQAVVAAERIRRRIAAQPVADGKRSVDVTVSLGIRSATGEEAAAETVVRLADEALYAAKQSGRNCVRTWAEIAHDPAPGPLGQGPEVAALQKQVASLSLQAKDIFVQSIQGLVNALEARDPYARSHSENVTHYAVHVAQEMGLDADEVALIRRAARLHDIGKIGVPDAILRKPSTLTAGERRVMKQHVATGVRILDELRFLEREIPIVRHHHERWDGSGYPDGIKGEAINPMARILAVADAFDALTSDRVYHQAASVPDVLRTLVEESGRQFDPQVVDALLAWVCRVVRDHGGLTEITTAHLLETAEAPAVAVGV
jgi:diguanylate cyclase (GGDEF)-like protein/PAS domain S-box-containing protein/putative nucleotidyltransferase with HDIG domain